MNRRQFSQLTAYAALSQTLLRGVAQQAPQPADKPRFSFMLWAIEKQAPFDRCIEMVAEAGYQGVELTGEFQKWSADETRRILGKMRGLGLQFDAMSGVKAGFCNADQRGEFMAQFTAQAAYARELECPQIILLSGKREDGDDPKAQYRTAIENLKRAADLVAKSNIEILIEPIDPLENPTIYLSSVSLGFEMVREIASPAVKVLYDFYHEQRAYGNLIEKLEKNIELVGLVHIADVPGRHEPGTGEVNYNNIYRKLLELKYKRFITMEYYPTEDIVTSLKKSRSAALQAMNIPS